MKSVASMPFMPSFGNSKAYYHPEGPVPAVIESSEPMGPVEIRRYVRTLRETRRFAFTNDLIYSCLVPDINS
jgi:hypothetical protein